MQSVFLTLTTVVFVSMAFLISGAGGGQFPLCMSDPWQLFCTWGLPTNADHECLLQQPSLSVTRSDRTTLWNRISKQLKLLPICSCLLNECNDRLFCTMVERWSDQRKHPCSLASLRVHCKNRWRRSRYGRHIRCIGSSCVPRQISHQEIHFLTHMAFCKN